MATSHFRHQLHLHGAQLKRLALLSLVLALLLPATAWAQRKPGRDISRSKKGKIKGITVNNLSDYDDRWFHAGLYFAPSFSRFFIEQSDTYLASGLAANSLVSPGFGVGLIGDVRLGGPQSPFILRFSPGVTFLTRRVEFQSQSAAVDDDSIFTQEVGSTVIQFPLLLKYQSDRRRNTRLYMIAGLSPTFTASNRRNDELRNVLRATDTDLTLEYGVGLDLFYPLFKFAPELRFSHGLRNVLVPGRPDIYSRSLQSLRTNSVTLYLNIQN
jgi:hypothetical protein